MRRKAYGFRVAGQTNQGSAMLAILGPDYVATKRNVNRDVDRARDKAAIASMKLATSAFSDKELSALATKAEYDPPRSQGAKIKSSAMPMNFWRGTGYGA